VSISAAKIVFDTLDAYHLEEIELNGRCKVPVINGVAKASKLKFTSTSYNHDVRYFFI